MGSLWSATYMDTIKRISIADEEELLGNMIKRKKGEDEEEKPEEDLKEEYEKEGKRRE